MKREDITGRIFKIERFCLHDGPGIRTVVYLKGCPLRCKWCANPEGQSAQTEWLVKEDHCASCGSCGFANASQAYRACVDDAARFEILKAECSRRVYEKCGYEITASSVAEAVRRDQAFYGENGGVTLSGGEVLFQSEFSAEVLRLSHMNNCSTAIETCGYGSPESMKRVLEYCDFVYFDVKHFDDDRHREATGVGIETIQKNLQIADAAQKSIVIRVPMIPGINMDMEFIEMLIRRCGELTNLREVQLLPYHKLGVHKYAWLHREYKIPELEEVKNEALEVYREALKAHSIPARIGGLT